MRIFSFALVLSACARELPPHAQVVVVADLDVAVPGAVDRLRIDLFDESGAWFATSDVARPDPRDWPVSFGIWSDEARPSRTIDVRLRAYVDGRTREDRSGATLTTGPAPAFEPDPLTTIDRIVRISTISDRKTYVRVVLRGSCFGAPARLGSDPATCIDGERTLAPVLTTPGDETATQTSEVGTWLAADCSDEGDRICVPGSATVFGTDSGTGRILRGTSPVRTVGVRTFFIDRYEYTVARYREALARGYAPITEGLVENDGPLGDGGRETSCTWSATRRDRERHPLNCVSFHEARGICLFEGGDLPTEVQWEHAATSAHRPRKTRFPWGPLRPSCDQAVFGRLPIGSARPECGRGTMEPIDRLGDDRTPGGIIGLGGNLAEWVLDDDSVDFDAPCWVDAPVIEPRCGDPAAPAERGVVRGTSWGSGAQPPTFRTSFRRTSMASLVGFRCVYPR
jgi:formylglycine-generating enzyme required for sulfatase activity